MTATYATYAQLIARLSPGYTAPSSSDAAKLLVKASELIEYATLGRSQVAWEEDDESAASAAATKAACDQVEYWLEVGEEHDVLGLRGSLQGGRVQIQRLPPALGQRAIRTLIQAGLLWGAAAAR